MVLDQLTIIYIACLVIVLLVGWIIRLEIKVKRLLVGKNAKSLEDSIIEAKTNLEELNEFEKNVKNHFLSIDKKLHKSIQAVETIRYNPFKGTGEGGNQSFATSFISENGNGVVISSLYSRDRVSVFSKPIQKFGSTFELTEEEKQVLQNSRKSLAE
ncbi:MAG: DUF4446 family protein [Minisyncoccia bacterium]